MIINGAFRRHRLRCIGREQVAVAAGVCCACSRTRAAIRGEGAQVRPSVHVSTVGVALARISERKCANDEQHSQNMHPYASHRRRSQRTSSTDVADTDSFCRTPVRAAVQRTTLRQPTATKGSLSPTSNTMSDGPYLTCERCMITRSSRLSERRLACRMDAAHASLAAGLAGSPHYATGATASMVPRTQSANRGKTKARLGRCRQHPVLRPSLRHVAG